jgi:hypothetical protein
LDSTERPDPSWTTLMMTRESFGEQINWLSCKKRDICSRREDSHLQSTPGLTVSSSWVSVLFSSALRLLRVKPWMSSVSREDIWVVVSDQGPVSPSEMQGMSSQLEYTLLYLQQEILA